MANGSLSRQNNIEYILFSEFDNKLGSTLKYQYPNDIPGLHSINLATLMIPDNMEKCLGKAEFTYFLLYFNSTTQKYDFVPSLNNMNKKLDILYFINICIARSDPANERGAVINSIAFGSKIPDFLKWKPLLTILLEDLMGITHTNNIDNDDNTSLRYMNLISDFFTRINRMDFLHILNRNLYQEIIQSINDGINEQIIINSILQKFKNSLEKNSGISDQGKTIISNNLIYYFLSIENPLVNSQFNGNKKLVYQKLLLESYVQTDIDYNKHALKIIKDISLEMANVEEINTILIFSTKTSKDYLCQLLFSISYLLSGVSLNKDPSFNGVYSFPYIDISMITLLKDFTRSLQHKKHKLIIGTSNLIFKIHDDIYDIFYDLDEEKIYTSSKIKTKEMAWKKKTLNRLTKSYKINNSINSLSHGLNSIKFKNKSESSFNLLTSIINGNNYTYNPTSFFNVSTDYSPSKSDYCHSILVNSFIKILINEQHDNKTVLNVITRIQILQLILLLKPITIKEMNTNTVFSLIRNYFETYNDLIYIDELFDINILKFIKLLFTLYELVEMVTNWDFFLGSTTNYDAVTEKINELQEIIGQSLFNISTNDIISYSRKLLYVCMNFPPLDILSHIDMKYKDSTNFDINMLSNRIVYYTHQQLPKSSKSDFQQTTSINLNSSRYSVIDKFVGTTAFNLFNKILSVDLKLNQKYDGSHRESTSTIPNSSLFLSPFKKRGKSSITRSLSFRNLLSLNVSGSQDFKSADYQYTMKETTVAPKNQTLLKSSISDSSTFSLPSKVLKKSTSMESICESLNKSNHGYLTDSSMLHVLEKKIDEVKSMIYEILRMIDDDKILGNIILRNYLNEQVNTQLDIYIQKYNLKKISTSGTNIIVDSNELQETDRNSSISLNKPNSNLETPIVSSLHTTTSIHKITGTSNKVHMSVDNYKEGSKEEEEEEQYEEEEIFYEIEYL